VHAKFVEESLRSAKICVCGTKIDVSCEASVNFRHISQNATPTEFAPCPDNAICKYTQHDTSKGLHLPRKMKMDTSKVPRLPGKLELIFSKRRKSIAPATQSDF
jgi:hypothetical protein